ncbi:hypothetical protein [Kribbella sp. CA-293567]|uniref:hypothetical protein n=1 Tax=Kribbella sp. CA-293567 TaxID=3002436 RepID=UPI0022DDA468|nr:hypothetical protein [Kribbella sp. CA-293567]WBQ07131.1 hypothetical protein OX958_10095 [Kribbella sp. CA-293567]
MNTPQPEPRLFHLVRPSCAAPVAEGVEWSDRTVTLRWWGQWPATSVWEGGVAAVLAVHGRNGATELRWLPATPSLSGTANERERAQSATGTADRQVPVGLRLAAPGVDGRCVSCGLVWPCLSCGP